MFGKVESERMPVRKVWDHAIDLNDNFKVSKAVTNFIRPITPRILARFPRSKIRRKALRKTFRTMPKMCQSDQYSLRYQLISAGH